MSFDNVPRCQHVKVNGTQCESPALRRRRLCFFHVRCQDQRKRIMSDQFKQAKFVVPVLEDANAIQMALMQIMQLLAAGQMEHRTGGLMLYALQTASTNLRHTRFEASDVTDVVIDREDVHRTAIGGPQWFEEDFEEEEEEVEEEGTEAAVQENGVEENGVDDLAAKPVAAEKDATERGSQPAAAAQAGKVQGKMTMDEAREKVRGVIHNWILDSVEEKARRELT
jgi:hypothetical protein